MQTVVDCTLGAAGHSKALLQEHPVRLSNVNCKLQCNPRMDPSTTLPAERHRSFTQTELRLGGDLVTLVRSPVIVFWYNNIALRNLQEVATFVGIDQDRAALAVAQPALDAVCSATADNVAARCPQVEFVHDNFRCGFCCPRLPAARGQVFCGRVTTGRLQLPV